MQMLIPIQNYHRLLFVLVLLASAGASAEEIRAKYPALTIVSTSPGWLEAENGAPLREYDIDSEPDAFLTELAKLSNDNLRQQK